MKIISTPWIALDLGSDRVHAAYLTSNQTAQSILPSDGRFETVFHVAPATREIHVGAEAVSLAETDPGGVVLLPVAALRQDTPINFPDGRGRVKPSTLFAAQLRRVREYCEQEVFDGRELKTCVLALPHRDGKLRRMLSKVAGMAGFTEIHFRDGIVAAATAWKQIWNEIPDYLSVCNLGASQTLFTLLKCQDGGSERVRRFGSSRTIGMDEIDRIILKASRTGRNAVAVPPDALLQIKKIRRHSLSDRDEAFRFYLNGRKKKVRSEHFTTGIHIVSQMVELRFKFFDERTLRQTGIKDIPLLLVGGGANIPVVAEAIERVAPGKVYWWADAQEAVALGTAMMFLPKSKPPFPTETEDQFHRLYEKAGQGNAEAQYFIGQALEMGLGVPMSLEEACDWYRLSAQNGSQRGRFGLSKLLYHGLGTVRDVEESFRLLKESAQAGFAPSQYSLGVFLHENNPHDRSEADEWMRKSAEQNYPEAVAFLERHGSRPPVSISAKKEAFTATSFNDWAHALEVLVDDAAKGGK